MPDLVNPSRNERRDILLSHVNVPATIADFALEGFIDIYDLWWLYEEHRIMSSADAWLLAMMWNDDLTEPELDILGDPYFWQWFER